MTDWNPDSIIDLLRRAGSIAMSLFDDSSPRLKTDMTVVTEADHRIEALVASELDRPEAGSYLIGEETIDSRPEKYVDAAFRNVAWVLDPVDGTAPYASHLTQWGVSLGRMEAGRLTDGAIYMPTTGEFFITDGRDILIAEGFRPDPGERSGGGRADHERGADAAQTTRVSSGFRSATLRPQDENDRGTVVITQDMAKRSTTDIPNPIQVLGCAVVPLSYLALGRYLGYVANVKLWDIAGGLPLLFRAGYSLKIAGGAAVTEAVDPATYVLEPGNPSRWRMRGHLVCAANDAILRYLERNLSIPAPRL